MTPHRYTHKEQSMTNDTTTEEPAEGDDLIPDEEVTTDKEVTTGADGQGEEESPNQEAAKYRRRLRDTEGERDTLAGRIEVMQRTEAERLAGHVLADGGDLWLTGTEVAGLLDDDGDLDPAKVTAAAKAITEERPHFQAKGRNYVPGEGSNPSVGSRSSWSDALAG